MWDCVGVAKDCTRRASPPTSALVCPVYESVPRGHVLELVKPLGGIMSDELEDIYKTGAAIAAVAAQLDIPLEEAAPAELTSRGWSIEASSHGGLYASRLDEAAQVRVCGNPGCVWKPPHSCTRSTGVCGRHRTCQVTPHHLLGMSTT